VEYKTDTGCEMPNPHGKDTRSITALTFVPSVQKLTTWRDHVNTGARVGEQDKTNKTTISRKPQEKC